MLAHLKTWREDETVILKTRSSLYHFLNSKRFDWQSLCKTNLRYQASKIALRGTPLLKKLNRARNDLSGKVIPLFKTYQDWEKKIIFEPFDQENLAGQPTILVRLNWPFFTPICQKAWQANYFIRAHRLKIHIKCSEFGFVAPNCNCNVNTFEFSFFLLIHTNTLSTYCKHKQTNKQNQKNIEYNAPG